MMIMNDLETNDTVIPCFSQSAFDDVIVFKSLKEEEGHYERDFKLKIE